MNIYFETFGCRLNRAEALDVEARCLACGHRRVATPAKADLIVVRGCSVTGRAQHDCEARIEHFRKKHPAARLVVTGCLPGAKKLDLEGLADVAHPVPLSTARAYLKVQDGCAGKCTFCIVPTYRGASASVDLDEVLDRARRFIDAGYRELVLTGCNLSLYASHGVRLPDLLVRLAALSPKCRVRLGSIEPGACAREVVDAIAATPNVCRFLHLPIQSGSTRVLQAMGRPYAPRDVDALMDEALRKLPFAGFGCDLMTGFPGESEDEFAATRLLLKRFPFSNVHVFPYSERHGTPAAHLANPVGRDIRHARAHELAKLAGEARNNFAKRFVGRRVSVLVEDNARAAGWTGEYLWLSAPVPLAGLRRRLRDFIVLSAKDDRLTGVPAPRDL